MPVVFPVVSYIAGYVRKDSRTTGTAYATAQAAAIGLLISSFYKALTGRPSPRHAAGALVDASREFHFGFLKGGVFYGWPSSHTTVAFAMSAAIWTLYPRSRAARCVALLYAFYIGLGVSVTIHWFSDFAAGALIGAAIGTTVGNAFRERVRVDEDRSTGGGEST
ncbi:MAG TPA: phosphatase PAP2 family protein [Thermodesulfovibrionales bacterium]|nr:phosphatase PAP2 family protein [Thermodesulfovibrionales bacterium]